jgi:dihydrofolate synthase/folylpolyglutamate synthase
VSYRESLSRLYAFEARGMRLGLERTLDALEHRGHPERGVRFVQVAGTNGKGSAAAMIAASLSAAGHRTGLFTSPHLHRYVERIRIDGRMLGQKEAARRIDDLLGVFNHPGAPDISFFEITTVLAVEAFRDHDCQWAVLEVGIGGRLDSTTALPASLSVITRIAMDHADMLGSTTTDIAREKAGIIRRGVPVVAGRCGPDARRVIARRAAALRAPMYWIDRHFRALPSTRGSRFAVEHDRFRVPDLKLDLAGEHQRDNAACAVAALLELRRAGVRIPNRAIRRGLGRVRWPGRLESIQGRPFFLLDGGHNPDAVQAVATHLERKVAGRTRIVLVFGSMADKDYPAMLKILSPFAQHIYYARASVPRAATYEQLARVHPGSRTRSLREALSRARRAAGPDGCVLVAGSVFLVAEARALLLGVRSDPPIRM